MSQTAFTLVELLTVIAIIAVLATLFLTAVSAAQKKSRATVCIANLHQISLALNMYLDDFDKRPPDVEELVNNKFLPNPRSLLCPEDKTGNWGRRVNFGRQVVVATPVSPTATGEPVRDSYLLQPLSWDQWAWNRLMEEGGGAGIAACQLHGLGKQDSADPTVFDFEGLLLRAQKDGAVVRRRVFWKEYLFSASTGNWTVRNLNSPPSQDNPAAAYPWPIYLDLKTNVVSLTNP